MIYSDFPIMLLRAKLINTECGLLERKKQNNKDLKICPSPRGNLLTQCWVTSLMELFEMQIFERKRINKLCPATCRETMFLFYSKMIWWALVEPYTACLLIALLHWDLFGIITGRIRREWGKILAFTIRLATVPKFQ